MRGNRARAALAWAAGGWALMMLAGWLLTPTPPSTEDAEFDARFRQLVDYRRAYPHTPFVVMLGSSRARFGFRPEVMPAMSVGNVPALPYNLAQFGAGPTTLRAHFRRLLAEGVRPARLLVELAPPFLMDEPRTTLGNIRLPWHCFWDGCKRLTECRSPTPQSPAPPTSLDLTALRPLGDDPTVLTDLPDAVKAHRRAVSRDFYAGSLSRFHIDPERDADLRGLLGECAAAGVPVTVVLMPEAAEFRSWYAPAALRQLDAYLAGLGVPLVDARTWLPDDQLPDGHHALRTGAEAFTRRLADALDSR